MLKLFWPDVRTEKGRMLAVLYGAIVLGIQVLGFFLLALIEAFPSLDPDAKVHPIPFRVIGVVFYLLLGLLFAALFNRLWQKHSPFAAGFGLLLSTLEVVFNLRNPLTGHAAYAYLLLLLSVHGVRGVQAMRRTAVSQAKKELSDRLRMARNTIASFR